MRIKLLGDEFTKVKLKSPLFKIFRILAIHDGEVYRLDPEEALYVIYEAVRLDRAMRELYSIETEMRWFALKRLNAIEEIIKVLDKEKAIEIKEEPLKPPSRVLEQMFIVHIPADRREFEVSEEVARVVWLEGESVGIPIGDFILRISWAPIYYNLSLDIIDIVKYMLRYSTQEVSKATREITLGKYSGKQRRVLNKHDIPPIV